MATMGYQELRRAIYKTAHIFKNKFRERQSRPIENIRAKLRLQIEKKKKKEKKGYFNKKTKG